ncbi:Hypothetical predicted protein [Paramuricea clavata]|uniref:Uncharacterized protein n=1 Tax=Paramuricea clavata TaxID=317549 RepID=A0A6S7JH34_PARCT|nr:Hypothetical predicted protein [Paramuricea clavata]
MKTLSTRSSPVILLPNDGQKQTNDQNEANHRDNERHWAWLRPNSIEQERVNVPSSRPLQAKRRYCYENGKCLLTVALFGIISMAMNCVVWYLVLGVDHKCQCLFDNEYIRGHSIGENFTDVLHDWKAKLQQDITDLSSKMDNFSKTLNDEHQCDGGSKNCRKKSDDGYPDAYYKEIAETLEKLYNQTEEDIARRFQQTNAKVERISEQVEKPNCVLKQVKRSKNGTLLTVHVPKSTEVLLVLLVKII